MTHLIVRFVTAILIAPLAASASDADDLRAVHEQTVKALNSGDLDSYLTHIHEQGITFYSCGPTSGVEGKASCQKQWEEFFATAERVNLLRWTHKSALSAARVLSGETIRWPSSQQVVQRRSVWVASPSSTPK